MLNLADRAAIARAELFEDFEILGPEIQLIFDANFELAVLAIIAGAVDFGAAGFGRWGRSRSGGCQGKALDVLALHGARSERISHGSRYLWRDERVCRRRRRVQGEQDAMVAARRSGRGFGGFRTARAFKSFLFARSDGSADGGGWPGAQGRGEASQIDDDGREKGARGERSSGALLKRTLNDSRRWKWWGR